MSFEGRKLRISRIYEKKKLAKMRDKNEKLKLKPPNLIRGIEKCLNRKGEFKEKRFLKEFRGRNYLNTRRGEVVRLRAGHLKPEKFQKRTILKY